MVQASPPPAPCESPFGTAGSLAISVSWRQCDLSYWPHAKRNRPFGPAWVNGYLSPGWVCARGRGTFRHSATRGAGDACTHGVGFPFAGVGRYRHRANRPAPHGKEPAAKRIYIDAWLGRTVRESRKVRTDFVRTVGRPVGAAHILCAAFSQVHCALLPKPAGGAPRVV